MRAVISALVFALAMASAICCSRSVRVRGGGPKPHSARSCGRSGRAVGRPHATAPIRMKALRARAASSPGRGRRPAAARSRANSKASALSAAACRNSTTAALASPPASQSAVGHTTATVPGRAYARRATSVSTSDAAVRAIPTRHQAVCAQPDHFGPG